ncbi:putative carboxypeptidase-like, regulatory domain superfamily, immunoglobulin-like protein [Helianthus annuus]|uniref:Carboxypeptidase-like, regulatory domain superfamily, immunoglobulin-like protein n=1 Tax=Helianthus annuus TaxID=4232 RepID=A0A9K3P185_HELAN|nr:putative carboxypeptidase-like, regulatory domain superfamily, immunoglobulin-like protein [Helianthus annuus]KAJ0610150.1 putative carboxypeptidase-like, regulatory domain superfamily, immunoglobulin-like protein [Helianthus annuus]KAJ0625353.1 putative carboxypeptidase-like, regulatory domain superfamily, immunoglobulin-like protein [Helianthus annuus]KAJ0781774.1 putative carboxypeptidase-like, regulatory domain superfamily, immunoglobulin-like protein [Helianthus annuus]
MALKHHNFLTFCFLFIVFTIHTATLVSADAIQGCGGFIEATSSLIKSRKPTDTKLDYSHVTVELRTLDGLVKERTQCAPNGYYFIPVYDKGSFVIKVKGPEGWSWNPDQVPVLVDHAGCNGNEDINFRFTGFSISGKVVGAVGGASCSSTNGGPSNVNVELLNSNGDVVSSVFTSVAGRYSFTNIIPGRYNLRASHNDLSIEVKGSTEVVELGFGNIQVDDVFFVTGYDIRGSVVAQGNPILGVHFYLYSNDVKEVHCPQGSGNPSGDRTALCHAISDVDGKFNFKSIPCGVYELIPYYKGENTVFDVSPPSVTVTVQHDHATVSEKFQVTGFSVGGRVVDSEGKGVDGVKIVVDGMERSVTDKNGYYKLDQVTSKQYLIEAKKEHYKFDKLIDFMVLPNMASVADIKAVSYDVCGSVHTVDSGYKSKVALTHGPDNVKPQMKQTDDNGYFCFEVPPGDYRLSAIAVTPETTPHLLFSPPHIDVNVNGPLLSPKFYQAQVNVGGSVTCKENCDASVSVDLVRFGAKRNEERQTVGLTLTDQSSEFLFENVLPGKYKLEVKHVSKGAKSGEDNWCWEQSSVPLDVGTEDVKGVNFVQKGYWVNLVSTHDVDAYLHQSHGSRVDLKIKKGSQRICVESPGVHELHFVNSCILFGNSPVKIDTANTSPIYLKGEKYLLQGEIKVDLTSQNGVDQLPKNLVVDILNDEGTIIDGTTAKFVNENEQSNKALYEYKVWANPGEKLTFAPRDIRSGNEKKILFYPRQHQVKVGQDGCQAVPPFSGRLGLYIEGSVSPPLPDVIIRIIASGDSQNGQIKENELAFETTTNADGLFVGGPLYDDITYHTQASKAGYHVKELGSNSFSCQKLGQISVRIHSKEGANDLFPSVLLSLSGEDGYRNNSISAAGGTFVFDNLFPGSFYLRPLLKEYAFSPSAQAVELGSGESTEVVFHATRVAYSAMGVVTLLSGLPKEGVSVEARSDSKGYYEETVTDSSGSYRLRGLHPDTTYTIKIAKTNAFGASNIERASPESVEVKVGYEDIKGLDFLVFEQPEITLLTGTVQGSGNKELHEHLKLEIRSASDPSNIESLLPLSISNFFQVKGLPRGKHLLQLRSTLTPRTLRFESDVIEVDLEKNTQVYVGPLTYRVEDDHHKQELTPAPVYPLIIGVLVIALFISMPRLKDMYQSNVGVLVPGPSATTKKAVRRKTY